MKVSPLDFILDPSPEEKRKACGNTIMIILYITGSVGIMRYRCHRWDCPFCGLSRKQELLEDLEAAYLRWYAIEIDDERFESARKRVKRDHAQYCAVGRGHKVLMLTNLPVFDDSQTLAGEQLHQLVEKCINVCPYSYRQRRIRHSLGLFPPKPRPSKYVHIKRRLVVTGAIDSIINEFVSHGYFRENYSEDLHYLRPRDITSDPEQVLNSEIGLDRVLWVESFEQCPS